MIGRILLLRSGSGHQGLQVLLAKNKIFLIFREISIYDMVFKPYARRTGTLKANFMAPITKILKCVTQK
jgi:hypothetical protein